MLLLLPFSLAETKTDAGCLGIIEASFQMKAHQLHSLADHPEMSGWTMARVGSRLTADVFSARATQIR